MDLNTLQQKASDNYDAAKKRKRELYQVARKLNFTPQESQILSGTSEETIHRLAVERDDEATNKSI